MIRFDAIKRGLDVCNGAFLLLVTSPLLLLATLAVRATMGGPAWFRQTRAGRHGELFTLYKLRTMRDGPEPDAVRLTPLGAFLRATSLDELPQLWNVLRGDMSLIGPRPLLPQYLPRYSRAQARRHEVRPGITGLAQVSGRNAVSWPERLARDVEYVDRRSLSLDAWILWRTLATVARRDGISATGHATMPEFLG